MPHGFHRLETNFPPSITLLAQACANRVRIWDMNTQAAPLSHSEVFERWLFACSANPWEPLTPTAAEPYSYVWRAWGRWLGSVPWHQAQAKDVLGFINSAAPDKDKPSDVTRRRYWRLLDRIYDFACLQELTEHNPVQDMAACDIPPSEDHVGAILTPRMWAALPKHFPDPRTVAGARDCAMLRVLMECAISAREVLALQLSDMSVQDGQVKAIHITGTRAHKIRTLAVSEACSQALLHWSGMRGMLGTSKLSQALFIGRDQPTLTGQALHKTTDEVLQYTALIERLPIPARRGPQVLRNTAIVQWLQEGQSVQSVIAAAGVKSPAGLEHLRHYLPLHVRQAIASSTPSEDND